jgi:N-acetylated-alpha-linked acidic dipeptidase
MINSRHLRLVLLVGLLGFFCKLGESQGTLLSGFTVEHNAKERTTERVFLGVPEASRARIEHEILTREPHVAGSPADLRTAHYMLKQFQSYGLDARIEEFQVPIPRPVKTRFCLDSSPGHPVFCGPSRESGTGASNADIQIPFNAFSASGRLSAPVVYANYGSVEDYKSLKGLGVSIRGKIVLARYGHLYRGAIVRLAELQGAKGVILYSDPNDDGYHAGDVYPNGPWRPESAIQRGSVLYDFIYPGLTADGATLPKIPVLPISSADARQILERLRGTTAPREWQGGLPLTYHLDSGPYKATLDIQIITALRSIWIVVATIPGSTLKDEAVIAGNHRDAWVYGGADPGSGSVALLEMARGLGELYKHGWRPQRTIMICSWDAEEEGELGSVAWAEQHARDVSMHTVAYLNVDEAVTGNKFAASATPSLKTFVLNVAKDTPSPSGLNLLEDFRVRANAEQTTQQLLSGDPANVKLGTTPTLDVDDLGGGTDFIAFSNHFGVPSTDFSFWGDYGVYHSILDNHEWMVKFGDPTFKYHVAASQFFGLQVLRLADADVLPFDYEYYGREISGDVAALKAQLITLHFEHKLNLQPIEAASSELTKLGLLLNEQIASDLKRDARTGSFKETDSALSNAEKAFLLPQGLPGRPWFRHAIVAPDINNGYTPVLLPGLREALDASQFDKAQAQVAEISGALNRACSVLQHVLH